MQVPSNAEETGGMWDEAWRERAEKNRAVPVSKKLQQRGTTSQKEKNMISSVFDGNYASWISHFSKNM